MTTHDAGAEPVRGGSGPGPDPAPPADADPGRPAAKPLTEAEAISSLSSEITPGREDLVQALNVVARLADRFGAVPSLRIGSIAVFNDDVLVENGDFTIGGSPGRPGGRGRTAVAPLAPEVLHRHIGAYIRPPGYDQALRILKREHLLVLAGPSGTGREACALALLADDLADTSRLHLVGEDLLASAAAWKGGEAGCGYVASEVDPAALAKLDDTWLRSTAESLRDAGKYLVVVTGAAAAAPGHPTAGLEFVVGDLGVPDPLDVLRARARLAVWTGRAARVTAALASPDLTGLLAEERAPRFAARVAVAVADAVNRDADPAAVIAALCDPTERVRAWFERTDVARAESDQEIALAIAVAVLDGCSYLAVTDAATALYRRLHSGETRLRFRRSLRSSQNWLEVSVPEAPATVHGDPMPETLRFRNPQVQAIVLSYVWTELDGLRPALIAWLRSLAGNPDVDVRACVSASAGLLATLDFTYAVHNLLMPWASSGLPTTRTCAGLALAVPSRDPRYAERVWALLREWVGLRATKRGNSFACTAAEAVGTITGGAAADRALEILYDVLERDDWDCLTAMALGLLSIIEHGQAARSLDALLDWSEEQDESARVVKTLAVFVAAVKTPAVADAADTVDAVEDPRPSDSRGMPRSAAVPGLTVPTASASRISMTTETTHADPATKRPRVMASGADGTKRILSGEPTPPPTPPPAPAPAARPSAPADHRPPPAHRPPPPAHAPWPVLLERFEEHRGALRDLWARALACKPVRSEALSALRSWIDLADESPAALRRVTSLCRAIRELGGKHRDRLDYHLDQWATHPSAPSPAAEKIRVLYADHR